MAIVRAVWGPFKRRIEKPDDPSKAKIKWGFFGVVGDHSTVHWTLTYDNYSGIWHVNQNRNQHAQKAQLDLQDMFMPADVTPQEGTLRDILKSKLKSEDVAEVARLKIFS